tara:strand:- start:66 stop:365 length:300 start_codon:yes stop_codon:yes gene_type:complete
MPGLLDDVTAVDSIDNWDNLTQIVSDSVDCRYHIRELIADALDVRYHIRALIADTLTIGAYHIRTLVSALLTIKNDIRPNSAIKGRDYTNQNQITGSAI